MGVWGNDIEYDEDNDTIYYSHHSLILDFDAPSPKKKSFVNADAIYRIPNVSEGGEAEKFIDFSIPEEDYPEDANHDICRPNGVRVFEGVLHVACDHRGTIRTFDINDGEEFEDLLIDHG